MKQMFIINIARIAMAVQVIEVAPVINLSEASGQVAAGLFMTEGQLGSAHQPGVPNSPSDHWYSSNWNDQICKYDLLEDISEPQKLDNKLELEKSNGKTTKNSSKQIPPPHM